MRVAILGNHLPRKCGIATFTSHVAASLRGAGVDVDVVAMNRRPGTEYPPVVTLQIEQDDLASYREAAEFLNRGHYDLLLVEHEFGIYGGVAGDYLLELLRGLNIPVITTLHTVLERPNEQQRAVLHEVIRHSQRLIVMSEKARDLLLQVHQVMPSRVNVIPHGIPDLPDIDADAVKADYGLAGRTVVLTFGLLSPNKGIDHAIRAMADVPDAVYIVAGQTHPEVVHSEGERYRASLELLVNELDLQGRVWFINRFVDEDELGKLLKMADVYVCPYLQMAQITSGTLAYTVGNGKAVVSTPFWHAAELLAEGRGVLVPPADHQAISSAINRILNDKGFRSRLESRAFAFGRQARWSEIGKKMVNCFGETMEEIDSILRGPKVPPTQDYTPKSLPQISLNHLSQLTDDTGLFQHALHAIPNRREGYCVDDNARALLLTVYLEKLETPQPELQARYLSFVHEAFNPETGRFRNFMSFDRRWLEEQGSEDSQARTIWALGTALGSSRVRSVRNVARQILEDALPAAASFRHAHACAYAILGLVEARELALVRKLADRLVLIKEQHRDADWPWFGDRVTYASGRLPQSMILAGWHLSDPDLVNSGLESLNWLVDVQKNGAFFHPVGSEGFMNKGSSPAMWDGQPIEAWAQISACLSAKTVTGDPEWLAAAWRTFEWFLGGNLPGLAVAVPETGGCHDGLKSDHVNENQGAESTLSYLCSVAEMTLAVPTPNRRRFLA